MAHTDTHVRALVQHIHQLQPDKDAARLCLYQYLKNLCDASEVVGPELINRFYARALSFEYWQQNKAHLFNETESLLRHFQQSGNSLDLRGLFAASDVQTVNVENLRNLEAVVVRTLEKTAAKDDKWRVLRDGESRVIAITLHADRRLTARAYSRTLALRDGELVPLHSDFTLTYTPELQLDPNTIHQIEVGPNTTARFHEGVEGLRGVFVRGYTFQKFASLEGGGLHRYPLLFYPLKRIEQFFVDRRTDPVYLELTRSLEEALELLESGSPEAREFAAAALERGRLALEHIYPEDKLTRLLLHLEKRVTPHAPQAHESAHVAAPAAPSRASFIEPEGIDLLEAHEAKLAGRAPKKKNLDPKDEAWPAIKNLPV
ncbi:MAG: hypothetical protein V4760_04935 [Bdellovibrionota bacterium]